MAKKAGKKGMGCGPTAAAVIVLIALIIFGGNEAVGIYFANCTDEDEFLDCMSEAFEDEPAPEEGTVVATGSYEHKGYSVNVTMNIPLQGGSVTGTVSGACDGKVKGTLNGGTISGSMSGTCDPFFVKLPASAEFSGSVNKSGKTVNYGFTGRSTGYSHQGSMSLTYP